MSANTQKNNKHKSAQFPFWKTKKFKNKKKKKNPQNLNIVKNDFVPSDEDKAIAQGILLNDKRLSFLARSGCNELVRDLIKNPHVASPDRLALIEHLAKASPKIFMPVEKVSLVKHAYEVHFFEKYDKNQVRDILAKLQLAQTRSASSLLEARLKAFKLDRDFFDPKTYEQSAKAVSQIRDSRIFDAEILDLKDRYIFWKISPSFVYAQLQIPKPTGKYKHHNEITDVRLTPLIKVREWPEIEQDFGINIRSNPFEYAEVLKLRVDNRGEPEVVLDYLRKLNLLTSNFENYLADAQDVLEKAAIEAKAARDKTEAAKKLAIAQREERVKREARAKVAREAYLAEVEAIQRFYIENPKTVAPHLENPKSFVSNSRSGSTDRTHRDRSVDGARDNWHMICPHCRVPYPFYSSCDCRY
jgi:hypothetical protein